VQGSTLSREQSAVQTQAGDGRAGGTEPSWAGDGADRRHAACAASCSFGDQRSRALGGAGGTDGGIEQHFGEERNLLWPRAQTGPSEPCHRLSLGSRTALQPGTVARSGWTPATVRTGSGSEQGSPPGSAVPLPLPPQSQGSRCPVVS